MADPAGPATVVAGLLERMPIPEDGTLSRVVFSDGDLRVVAFAFDRGQQLTEHTAAVPAVLQVLSGRMRAVLDGVESDLAPGDWAHLPAHLSHSLQALEPAVLLLTMVGGGSAS